MAIMITKVINSGDPTVNDDLDLGYAVGSVWTNSTSGDRWVCTDNTDAAAVWESANVVIIDDDTMATATATSVSSSESVKAYVDGLIASPVNYIGGYNASTNVPDLDSAPSGISIGDMYTVTADGTFFTEAVQVGDVLISEQDNPTLLVHWTIVEGNTQPASETVAGYIEIATSGEIATGTDNTRAVSPLGLEGWNGGTSIATVGTLDAGAISSNFGNIDIGTSTISATGTWTGPSGTWSATGINLATGDNFQINSVEVLNGTGLGTAVVNSSLTSVGELTDLTIANTGGIRTSTTAADTLLFQAYDTDLTGYVTFATLTANNTPTFVINSPTSLESGVTAATQSPNDNSTSVATTAYVDAASGSVAIIDNESSPTVNPSATGVDSVAIGDGATASAVKGFAIGSDSEANEYGMVALPRMHANGALEAHSGFYGWGGTITSTTLAEIYLGGVASNQLNIPSDSMMAFRITVVGFRSAASAVVGYTFEGLIKNLGGVTSFTGSPLKTILGESNAGFDVEVIADDTADALVVQAKLNTGVDAHEFAAFGTCVRIR